jgi:hypothetical protein
MQPRIGAAWKALNHVGPCPWTSEHTSRSSQLASLPPNSQTMAKQPHMQRRLSFRPKGARAGWRKSCSKITTWQCQAAARRLQYDGTHAATCVGECLWTISERHWRKGRSVELDQVSGPLALLLGLRAGRLRCNPQGTASEGRFSQSSSNLLEVRQEV